MTDPNGDPTDDDDNPTRTTIEVDREVWRQVRAEAVGEGKNISAKLEEILRDHFDMSRMIPMNNTRTSDSMIRAHTRRLLDRHYGGVS